MALRPFGFQADEAFAGIAIVTAGHFLSVDRQLNTSVATLYAIVIPLTGRPRASLAGQTTHPTFWVGTVGHKRCTLNGKHVTMRRRDTFGVIAIDDLQFDRLREGLTAHGQRTTVNE